MAAIDTTGIERSLLRLLTSSKIMLRRYFGRVVDGYMATPARKFIFKIVSEQFRNNNAVLSDKVLVYEVRSRIDDKDTQDLYLAEWEYVKGVDGADDPEALIGAMERERQKTEAIVLIEAAGELLLGGDVEEGIRRLKSGAVRLGSRTEDIPVAELTDYAERKALMQDMKLHPAKYAGMRTGFTLFDNLTGGLYPGEMTLLAAVTGVGKSTIMKAIERNVVMLNQGKNVLHVTNEETLLQVLRKFDSLVSDVPFSAFKKATITDAEMVQWEKTMQELAEDQFGRVFIKEIPAWTSCLEVERVYYELQHRGVNIDLIAIDLLDHLSPIHQAWGEHDEEGKKASDARELARSLNKHVLIATQAATVVEEKQEKGRKAGKLDVYGSKKKIHPANTFIIITQERRDEKQKVEHEWERDYFWDVGIKKNRDGPPFSFRARHCVRTGRVEEMVDRQKSRKQVADAAQEDLKGDADGNPETGASPEQPVQKSEPGPEPEEQMLPEGDAKSFSEARDRGLSQALESIQQELSSEPPKRQVVRRAISSGTKLVERPKNGS